MIGDVETVTSITKAVVENLVKVIATVVKDMRRGWRNGENQAGYFANRKSCIS